MNAIKARRLNTCQLASHPGLYVGQCVPFYFCPRSVMLYVIYRQNHPSLSYFGGQQPIVHLEADLHKSIQWANANGKRWAFTTSNAGSAYFSDYSNINNLNQINWSAVQATRWGGPGIPSSVMESKQAEFLIEGEFPWSLIDRIGVHSQPYLHQVNTAIAGSAHQPIVSVQPGWYYQ